jgi:hypothetical protein
VTTGIIIFPVRTYQSSKSDLRHTWQSAQAAIRRPAVMPTATFMRSELLVLWRRAS